LGGGRLLACGRPRGSVASFMAPLQFGHMHVPKKHDPPPQDPFEQSVSLEQDLPSQVGS
jgi:hypothetical protein